MQAARTSDGSIPKNLIQPEMDSESILFIKESFTLHDFMAENWQKELTLDSQESESTQPWSERRQ